ncbi:MAG: Glyoxalase [Tardiphaga sp.]|nr:Glyoxalase [Tardiphaga sp.]
MLFNQAPAIRTLIADDHEVVPSGLRSIVECHQQKGPAARDMLLLLARDAERGERFFHLIDPDGHELSFARPWLPVSVQ